MFAFSLALNGQQANGGVAMVLQTERSMRGRRAPNRFEAIGRTNEDTPRTGYKRTKKYSALSVSYHEYLHTDTYTYTDTQQPLGPTLTER